LRRDALREVDPDAHDVRGIRTFDRGARSSEHRNQSGPAKGGRKGA